MSGNIRPHSPQLAESLWTDPGLKSGICVASQSPLKKKRKNAKAGNEWSSVFPKSAQARRRPPPPLPRTVCPLNTVHTVPRYVLCACYMYCLTLFFFYSVLVPVSVFMALSTVFHSIASPDNSPLSHCSSGLISGLLVFSTVLYLFVKVSLSPDIILCD